MLKEILKMQADKPKHRKTGEYTPKKTEIKDFNLENFKHAYFKNYDR